MEEGVSRAHPKLASASGVWSKPGGKDILTPEAPDPAAQGVDMSECEEEECVRWKCK